MCNFSKPDKLFLTVICIFLSSNEPQFIFHIIHKNEFKWFMHLNKKHQTIKLLKENTGENFCDL